MDMKTLLPYIMIAAAIGPALWIAWRRHKKLPWLRYWLLALLCLLLPFVYAMASGHGDTVSKAVWTLFFTGLSVLGGGLVPVLISVLLHGAGRFMRAIMTADLTMEEDEENVYIPNTGALNTATHANTYANTLARAWGTDGQ
jgi:hypothetical protein